MGQPIFRVGGISSGLDTESIINSLVGLERIPINRMAQQRAVMQAKNDAWTDISTQVSQLRTTVDDLRTGTGLQATTASSGQPDAVEARVIGSATPGAVDLQVDQLAATHQATMTLGLATATTAVGAGSVTITVGGTPHVINTTASTTLSDLATSIRSLDIGVDAVAMKVTDNDHRLVVTAQESGLTNNFTLATTIGSLGAEQVLTTGADAQLKLGSGAGALTVSRSSNLVSDLIDGLELELKTVTAGAVTIRTDRDTEAIADNIEAMFEAANGVITELQSKTLYDVEANRASILTGDPMVRTLDSRLSTALSSTISAMGAALAVGSPVTHARTGLLDIDRDKLVEAISTDFAALEAALENGLVADDSRVTPTSTTSSTLNGTYPVIVTSEGTSPTATSDPFVASGSVENFDIQYGNNDIAVSITASSDLTSTVSQINAALVAAGVTDLIASEAAGSIQMTTPDLPGASNEIIVTNDAVWGLDGTYTGTDATGTIDGEVATATKDQFSATSGSPNGLSMHIDLSAVDTSGGPVAVGSVTYAGGLLQTLHNFLSDVEGASGLIAGARDEHDASIDAIDDSIAAMELRIDQREITLRRQYTAMERAMSQLQQGAAFLNGLLTNPGGDS